MASIGAETARSAASSPHGAYYAAAQAKSGASLYAANCSRCHGTNLEGVSGPPLKGPAMQGSESIADIYSFLSQQMPAGAPGSLSPSTYVAIMAYLLQQNGHPAGHVPLSASNVKKIGEKI